MPSSTPLLRLRRGVPVLPRGDGLVLVGTDPAHHVVLPDTASVARLLAQLRLGLPSATAHQTPDDPTATVLAALRRAGLVVEVDQQALLREARAATRVSVQAPDPWLSAAQECVRLAGLALATGSADVTWVLSAGPPDWDVHDALLAADDPVLFTTVHPSRLCLGPFVLPGTTACLRCLAAQSDGVRPPRSASGEPVGMPEDLSPLLLRQGLLQAATDLTAWAEGRQPATWSATTWLDGTSPPVRRAWPPHPHCGCRWDQSMTG